MGKPAARLTDFHMCPMVTPGLPPIPHVGGPITGPGCPTVLIGGMPAAVMGDMCVCVGPPDTIVLGSTGVFFGGKPAARMGDTCAHGGAIMLGCPTVLIGEAGGGGGGGISSMPVSILLKMVENMPSSQQAAINKVISLKEAAANGSTFAAVTPKKNEIKKEPPKKIEKDKVGLILVDKNGKPMSNVSYEIKTPDGSIRKGKTDKDGKATESGITQGNCKISFPDLHADEWGTN